VRTGTGSSSGSGVASGVMHSASGIAPCRSISRDDGRMPSVERIARGVQLPRSRTCGAAACSRAGLCGVRASDGKQSAPRLT
jgi:hypothetical protein